jgi:hypothetical protein
MNDGEWIGEEPSGARDYFFVFTFSFKLKIWLTVKEEEDVETLQ